MSEDNRISQKILKQGREIGRLKHQISDLKMLTSDKYLLLLKNKDDYIHRLEIDNKEKDDEIKLLGNEIEYLKNEIAFLLLEDVDETIKASEMLEKYYQDEIKEEQSLKYRYKDKTYKLISDNALIQVDDEWIKAIIYTNDTKKQFVRSADEFYAKFQRI